MNIPRLILIVILLLSLFVTAKSFVAVHNVEQWSDELQHFFAMELGAVNKRSYPINFYTDRIEAIQKQWTVMRYVSVASVALCCGGIFVVSRKPRNIKTENP